jgi:hypothetical protein
MSKRRLNLLSKPVKLVDKFIHKTVIVSGSTISNLGRNLKICYWAFLLNTILAFSGKPNSFNLMLGRAVYKMGYFVEYQIASY